MNAYANASITIDCTSLLKYVNQETTLSSHPSPIFFLPGISVYKEIKNFDEDPISYEEEIDLQASYQDYLAGRYRTFSSNTPRETIMKFLDDL